MVKKRNVPKTQSTQSPFIRAGAVAAVGLGAVYILASWSIDNGSLLSYAATLLALAVTVKVAVNTVKHHVKN